MRRWIDSSALKDAVIEIKTVRANGFSQATTQCRVSELRAQKATLFSQYNFRRYVDPGRDVRVRGSLGQRIWAVFGEAPRAFKISKEEGVKGAFVKEGWVWPAVARRIEGWSGMAKSIGSTAKS